VALDGSSHPEPLSAPPGPAGYRRVAFATCLDMPDLATDEVATREPLAALGITLEAAAWDDPQIDWSGYDLVVLRSTWNYIRRHEDFVAWARAVPRLANPAEVVAWNTDKQYLRDLAAAGVPVVPTAWIAPDDHWVMPAAGEWVIKPAVSGGSRDTGRYAAADPVHRELAAAHLARLRSSGRLAMVQPYLAAVDVAGETALLFLGGAYSHAVRKGPLLDGPDRGQDDRLFRPEAITAREPSAPERALAQQALAAVPGQPALLYARVDLIPGPDGAPILVELELTEPSLFLDHSDGAPARLADAIAAALIPAVD
jgi:hypothetical protein